MLIAILILALLAPPHGPRKARGYRAPHKVENTGYPTHKKKPRTYHVPRSYTSVTTSSVRLEYNSFRHGGNWTNYEDGIYVEPGVDMIHIISSWPGDREPYDPRDIWQYNSEVFGQYRHYANLVCPTTLEERLEMSSNFRVQLEQHYRRTSKNRRDLFGEELSFEQFVAELPDCDAKGGLWKSVTRFVDWDEEQGLTRMLTSFSNDVVIQQFLNRGSEENYLPRLKSYLRDQGRVINSPLAPKQTVR